MGEALGLWLEAIWSTHWAVRSVYLGTGLSLIGAAIITVQSLAEAGSGRVRVHGWMGRSPLGVSMGLVGLSLAIAGPFLGLFSRSEEAVPVTLVVLAHWLFFFIWGLSAYGRTWTVSGAGVADTTLAFTRTLERLRIPATLEWGVVRIGPKASAAFSAGLGGSTHIEVSKLTASDRREILALFREEIRVSTRMSTASRLILTIGALVFFAVFAVLYGWALKSLVDDHAEARAEVSDLIRHPGAPGEPETARMSGPTTVQAGPSPAATRSDRSP
ncbi:MAG: hypothetical protein HXY25_10655 [Alphaproteobacteria bacterium]|nr:hypothetical protein [Alphaproteobacteria bacterium]